MRFISPRHIAHSNCGPVFSLVGVGVLKVCVDVVVELAGAEDVEAVEDVEEVEVVLEDVLEVVLVDFLTPVISRSSGSMGEGGSSRNSGDDPPPNSFLRCDRRVSNELPSGSSAYNA